MDSFDWVSFVIITLLAVVSVVREMRVRRELSRLRVLEGEFTESDIENVFRHALLLEGAGNRERSLRLFEMVATHSTDSENAQLARESMERICRQSK